MDGREFRSLLSHMEWADAHTWRAVRAAPGAHTDDRLRWLLHHLHLVQSVYLQAWRGDPFVVTELASYPDLPAIEAWARPFYPKAFAFAESLDEATLGTVIDYPWANLIVEQFGSVVPSTLSESAWQVLSHTTYHRGQVATRIRELGGQPPLVDFLVWVWGGRPPAEWLKPQS
jgi:uncharacterized damage-inducible protein DinB